MGLDMYLNRMPRYGDTDANQIYALEQYFNWRSDKRNPESKAKNYTLKAWCGVNYKDVPNGDVRKFYEQHHTTRYYPWDDKKKYPIRSIVEEVGYWRKANHIHNWFVQNVQNGADDCDYHEEVTKETLEELLDVCRKVLASCDMVDGKINVGAEFRDGKEIPIMEDGQYVKDPSIAEELLPCRSGFFFGGTDYDSYYVTSIRNTIDIIEKVLETTDFEKQMIYYVSSW